MPCYTEPPERSKERHLEIMFCYCCRFLSVEQMASFKDNSGYIGIEQWYAEHLMHDLHESADVNECEAGTLIDESTLDSFFNKEETIKKYRQHCISELNRLGYKIEINEKYVSIEK